MNEKPSPEKRFVVDSMLGKMAKWLRVLGFDTRYEYLNKLHQVTEHLAEGFFIVTKNQRWCGLSGVICIAANDPNKQLLEVAARISLRPGDIQFLNRCILCNALLAHLPRNDAFGLVPDYVFETQTDFSRCPHCQKVYWSGSHPNRMLKRLQDLLGWAP
jgi:uncharacterized protein